MARSVRLHIVIPALAGSLFAYSAAMAQSTGSQVEQGEVIVTAQKVKSTGGLAVVTTAAKDQYTITGAYLGTQINTQNFAQSLNLLPGISYTNEDPTGASPGDFRMNGFDGAHVSFTIDGMPLNDTGNYAIYPSEYVQNPVIDHITVNQGQTEVDSPTASAIGGTVNIVSKTPPSTFGALGSTGYGSYDDRNAYAELDTGAVGPWGTRSYVAVGGLTSAKYKGEGDLNRLNFDGNIYQPLPGNDFIGVAFSYAKVRNYFYESNSLAQYQQFGRSIDFNTQWNPPGVAGNYTSSFPSASAPGFEQGNNSNFWALHPNPTDFGDIRAHSLFDLSHGVTLAVDPYFFYTLANGGGATYVKDTDPRLWGSAPKPTTDGTVGCVDQWNIGVCNSNINKLYYSPSNTQTHRYGLNSSLIWDLDQHNRFQLAYTFDDGHHRQTGEYTGINQATGEPDNIFGAKQGYGPAVTDLDGSTLRKRDRFSIAELNQFAVNYVGKFMDDKLHFNIGLRDPMFTRNLNQFCYMYNGGSEYCDTGGQAMVAANPAYGETAGTMVSAAQQALDHDNNAPGPVAGCSTAYTNTNPGSTAVALTCLLGTTVKYGVNKDANFRLPFKQTYHFDKVLPNAGVTYDFDKQNSVYLTFAEGFSAPKTDDLYVSTPENVQPETTYTYGAGYRFTAPTFTLSSNAFYTVWQNHIVSSVDPNDPTLSIDRNVGQVNIYGLELEGGWRVTDALTLYASGTLEKSALQNNYEVAVGTTPEALPVKGKELVLTPDQLFSARAQYKIGDFTVGGDLKYEGKRYIDDINSTQIGAFLTTDLDVAYHFTVNNVKSTLQLNVYNLFGENYWVRSTTVGNATPVVYSAGTYSASSYYLYTGAPTTAYITLKAQF
jgi:iron complex outermembrane receptor protein